tara:strand:+ start:267 stop:554 length:288 start_codon:yes stop_codon:yes gene_type:complete
MSAYVIAFMQITDHKKYETYKDQVPETIALYDGDYLVRGGEIEIIEGNFNPERAIILKFPSVERAKDWISSEEYKNPKKIRHNSAISNVILLDGI